MKFKINTRLLMTILSAIFIISGTFLAIQYAKGSYRLSKGEFVANSGLLAANSFPPGAEVYVDDKLVSATDDTIYLEPGEYQVKIVKDGFSPWQKKLRLEKELVTQTNATLFPQVSSLIPLTFTGASNITPSPDGQKISFFTASASAETKNGLYSLELTNNLLSLQKGAKQISTTQDQFGLQKANVIWSPDSSEILLFEDNKKSFLLETDKKNSIANLEDVSLEKKTILSKWEEEIYIRERQFLKEFPTEIILIATESAKNVYLSPDKKKILYTATEEQIIPESIVPPQPASNTQPENRKIQPGFVYIYDREEDKNFLIGKDTQTPSTDKYLLANDLFIKEPKTLEASPASFTTLQATTSAQTASIFSAYHTAVYANKFQWFPDSSHIIYTKGEQIRIMEYDGTNDTVVYSGPFLNDFVYPWPDGSKLIILTSFSSNSPPNLYAIELK